MADRKSELLASAPARMRRMTNKADRDKMVENARRAMMGGKRRGKAAGNKRTSK